MVLLQTAVLWLLFVVVSAQESPFVFLPKFSNLTASAYRTNVCERHAALVRGEVELRDALKGLDLTVAMTNYRGVGGDADKLFQLDDQGRIPDTEQPGLFVVLLDEVARRAGFTWRHSFVTVDPVSAEDATQGKTWTDLLLWEINNFDLAVDYWARSAERMAMGVSFPHGWYDGSIVLAFMQSGNGQNHDETVNLWSFLQPFEASVWLAIVAAIVFTGIVYFLLERMNANADERQLEDKPAASILLAALTFTGHFQYMPDTNAARLLSFSWSFWALIMISGYTANMASFLVSQNRQTFMIKTIDEALEHRVPVCVQRGAIIDDILSEKYPQLVLVRKDTEQEMIQALRQSWFRGGGGCGVVLTNLGTLELFQNQKETNADCSLTSDKRVVLSLPAGFATAVDSGVLCTSLVSYVLDVHLQEMRIDGFIDNAWQDHLSRISTVQCDATSTIMSAEDTTSLSARDMGGIFILLGLSCGLALVIAWGEFLYTKRYHHRKRSMHPLFEEAGLRSSMLKKEAVHVDDNDDEDDDDDENRPTTRSGEGKKTDSTSTPIEKLATSRRSVFRPRQNVLQKRSTRSALRGSPKSSSVPRSSSAARPKLRKKGNLGDAESASNPQPSADTITVQEQGIAVFGSSVDDLSAGEEVASVIALSLLSGELSLIE